jgi:threonine/homoserine/homoserine lactone efflux protein
MSPTVFALSVLVLLATPGPTNTLLAAAGAAAGLKRSLGLVAAELGGYLTAIGLLSTVLGAVIAERPALALALKLAAGVWLACCALRLWRQSAAVEAGAAPISGRRVFLTTVTNPKALVFALVLLPPLPLPELVPWLAGFSALVMMVGSGWVALGALLARSAASVATPRRVCRAAAVALTVFATILAGSALAGAL